MVLVCHVISREHMFKGLCKFMGGNPFTESQPCLVAISLVQGEV